MTLERLFIPSQFLSFYSVLSIKFVSLGGFYNTLGNLITPKVTLIVIDNSFEKFWKKVGKDLWMTSHVCGFMFRRKHCAHMEEEPKWIRLAVRTWEQRSHTEQPVPEGAGGTWSRGRGWGVLPGGKRSSKDRVWWADGSPHSLCPCEGAGTELRKVGSRFEFTEIIGSKFNFPKWSLFGPWQSLVNDLCLPSTQPKNTMASALFSLPCPDEEDSDRAALGDHLSSSQNQTNKTVFFGFFIGSIINVN